MAEHDPDDQQLFRCFPLFSNKERPDLDALAIVVELFEELEEAQRRAAINYLNARFTKEENDA